MTLRRVQRNWEKLAGADPFNAILDGAGCQDAESFFQTGETEVGEVLEHAATLGLPKVRGQALDFGCGVGRLTQALAGHFDRSVGVDLSPTMIRLARDHNRVGDRCRYVLNEANHLREFGDDEFDFIYSNITLQHMLPRLSQNYLREFLRLLAPGGLLVFLVPEKRIAPGRARLLPGNTYQHLVRLSWPLFHPGEPLVEMYGVPRRTVLRIVNGHGGRALDVQSVESAGSDWRTFRYAVTVS